MAHEQEPTRPDPSSLEALEQTIVAAGAYVWPSEDLRPRVIELARQRALQRRTLCQLGAMMVAASLCVVTGVSLSSHLQARADSASMPRGERLEQLVIARGAQSSEGQDWALAGIVGDWRSELAARLSDGGRRPAAVDAADQAQPEKDQAQDPSTNAGELIDKPAGLAHP